jgi:8-oxo-dGTP pyrophosphatase MutT (NUDIX family)
MSNSPKESPLRGVVAVILRGERFLVIRRSQHVRAPGMHCFPGGAIEAGESEDNAVCREMREELALPARPLRRIWRSVTPWNVELAWWLAEIDAEATPLPNPHEVEAYLWLTAAEIRALPNLLPSNLEFLAAWDEFRGAEVRAVRAYWRWYRRLKIAGSNRSRGTNRSVFARPSPS